jgi:hypothetical protein
MSKSTNTGGGCPCVIVWKNGLLFIFIFNNDMTKII